MSSTAPRTSGTPGTQGPLPPSVYWRRRLFVVGVLVALVLIAVNSVRGGGDSSRDLRATTASADRAEESGGLDLSAPSTRAKAGSGTKARKGRARTSLPPLPSLVLPTVPVLVEPEGECADDDITVSPMVQNAVAGQSATIVLRLRTITAAACTWQASPDNLAVRISVGDDEVWASRECTRALPARSVVVRQAVTSTYQLTWNTRRSDDGCSALTDYAEPGDYRVTAAALGGEPDDLVFDLSTPTIPAPTPTPTPTPTPAAPERSPGADSGNRTGTKAGTKAGTRSGTKAGTKAGAKAGTKTGGEQNRGDTPTNPSDKR